MFFSKLAQRRSTFLAGAGFLALVAGSVQAGAQEVAVAETEAVIVTGTRVTGMTAADSSAPITVIASDALSHIGQPNLIQALAQLSPSFSAESRGGDTGNLTLSARLRGLSPNDTLVLVNGKRRHATGNLHVGASQFQGAATADLDLIPVAAIDHIEVLEEGAAAQYGTDAIAGVVNIILKKNASGGVLNASAGQYFKGDGETYDYNGNIGLPLGSKGFLSLTADKQFRGFTQTGGQDIRLVDADGNPRALAYPVTGLPGYPRVNQVEGLAESQLTTIAANLEYEVAPAITLYGTGTYGERQAKAHQNYRQPNQVIATAGSNQPFNAITNPNGYVGLTAAGTPAVSGATGTFTTPGELIPFPLGFTPVEALREDDYGYTLGLRGDVAGFNWDLSGTYGKDRDKIYTLNSANLSLFKDTHTTPSDFYDGSFTASEATFNLDINREFNVGLASPLTVAFGGEGRENTFAIGAGDAGSTYKEGGQAYPGFHQSDAGGHSRKNYAAYLDFAVSPIENLQVDIAGRFEHYTDFGDAQVGKITARYDFTPQFAVRGTISTGFRAATLQEEFYSATNTSPTTATVQLPPNSAAAALLGVKPLQPEASTSYSLGVVAHPLDGLNVTVDAYSISLRNRIVGTGSLYGSGGAINSPIVTQAIIAHGNVLDPTVTQTGVSIFLNGISTLTQGVDISANYLTDLGNAGNIGWTLAGNYTDISISNVIPTPTTFSPGVTLFSQTARTLLTHANPKEKVSLSALWSLDDWTVNLRETLYGPSSVDYSPNGGTYYTNKVSTKAITDLEASYRFLDAWTLSVGANNLFDERPETVGVLNATTLTNGGSIVGAPLSISPYGTNGGYYYTRVSFTF
ncbi:MAG: TonB-dependent receptor [Alphaproteobacteria bacterium]|nr:TonB-dependent receptor [Alphaproteobacteria bacterium]